MWIFISDLYECVLFYLYVGSYLTHSHQIGGRWVKGYSAGGCRNNSTFSINPKLWLKVCERGEVLLSLLQYGRPESPAEGGTQPPSHLQAIALHVWKVREFLNKHFLKVLYVGFLLY